MSTPRSPVSPTALTVLIIFMAGAAVAGPNPDLTMAIAKDPYVRDQLTAVFSDGPVFFNHLGQSEWRPVTTRQTFIDGDGIRTGNNGYVVLAFSTDNLLLVKPKSGIRFHMQPLGAPRVLARVHEATLMLSVRDSQSIQVDGQRGTLWQANGEASFQSNGNHDIVKSLHGEAMFRIVGSKDPTKVPEGHSLEIDSRGQESPLSPFDTRMEYDSFRRFNTFLRNFDEVQRAMSTEISYKVDSVLVNGVFLSNLELDPDGYRIIDPGAEPVPREIHLQIKITPYPRPEDRFELYFSKDLIYALREGRDGFYEVRFPVPTFPEFFVKVHYMDSLGRADRIFENRFVIFNRHRRIEQVRVFLKQLSMSFERRDLVFLRDHVSREYRDSFGNTYFHFVRLLEDNLRKYQDIRLVLHPHTFKFKGEQILVNMNYKLSALTGSWLYRYEDLGAELMTLEFSDGDWRIRSKAKGMFFQAMKVAVDLRQGVLRGRVTDENSGYPIPGATVRLLNTAMKTVTDVMGEYVIYNIPTGKYDVEINKNGYGKVTVSKVEVYPTGERF